MPTQHRFRGSAFGAAAVLTTPFDEILPTQASANLADFGGFGSGRSEGFRHRDFIHFDLAHSEAKLAIAALSLFGFSADVIVDSGTLYLKSSLTGDKYQKLDTSTLTAGLPIPSLPVSASPDPSAAAAMIDQLKAELDKLPAPTKLADEKIGNVDCYHVQQKVSSTDVPEASGLPAGTVTLDIWSSKADYRPCRVGIAVDGGAAGTLAVTVDLTNYDAPVDIAPPPADQISDQPFSIPGLTP